MPAIENISVSLEDLNKQEHQFHRYAILGRKNVYSILSGRHSSKLRGRGLDFEEVRKYVPGDDIRNIDWKVTARTKNTHSKVFNEEKERPNYTVVDQTSGMFFGSRAYTKSYIAAMLSAVAGFKVLKSGDRFGGLIFGDDAEQAVAPKRSRKNLQHFFSHLVTFNQGLVDKRRKTSHSNRLNEVLHKVAKWVNHDHVIFIISDFLKADDETIKLLLNLTKHNDVICAIISDPLEQELPERKILLGDGERQLLWKKEKALADQYREKASGDSKAITENLIKYGIPVLHFNTADDVAEQMKGVIQKILRR